MTANAPSARAAADRWDDIRSEARLVMSWARRGLHSQYRQSSLQIVWSVAQPLSVFAVYVMVFHYILKVSSGSVPYLSFMIVGLTVWRYFAVGLNQASSLVYQANMLNKVYFRREIIPLSGLAMGLIDLGVGTVAMIVVSLAQGVDLSVSIIALPVVYVALILYSAAAGVLLAVVAVFVRDLVHVMPTLTQLIFLATPIMYPPEQLPPNLQFLATLNPIAVLAEAARSCVLEGQFPSATVLVVNLVLSAALFVLVITYVRSIEHRIVDIA